MNVFIIASVDKKVIKKSTDLNSEMIVYCPVLTKDESISKIKEEFLNQNPDKILLLVMPLESLQKQVQLGKDMLKKIKEKKQAVI